MLFVAYANHLLKLGEPGEIHIDFFQGVCRRNASTCLVPVDKKQWSKEKLFHTEFPARKLERAPNSNNTLIMSQCPLTAAR